MVLEALTCRELVELITDYLEGQLTETERRSFEQHLAGCAGCRNYLDQMAQTIELVERLTQEHLAPAARDELLEAFRAWNVSGLGVTRITSSWPLIRDT
jgi:predicted anti-sigma-YlaC factor YlaD